MTFPDGEVRKASAQMTVRVVTIQALVDKLNDMT